MSESVASLLSLLLVNLLLGLLCLAVGRGERPSAALRLWGWGLITYVSGLLISIVGAVRFGEAERFTLAANLTSLAANTVITLAPVLSVRGVLSHTRHRLSSWAAGAAVGAVLIVLAVNALGPGRQPVIDQVAPTVLAIVLFVAVALLLLADPPGDARGAAGLTAGAMLLAAAIWTLRVAVLLGWVAATGDAAVAQTLASLMATSQQVATVAATFALFAIEVRKMEGALRRAASVDELTGLPNRRSVLEQFPRIVGVASRNGLSIGLVLFDVDHFKTVNDLHGHLAGDALLRHVSGVLAEQTRAGDLVGRVGGEEFVVLLANAGADDATKAAESIRRRVEASSLGYGSRTLQVTVSAGVAAHPADGETWDALFAAADRRLYDSKRGGRNRVTGPAEVVTAPGSVRGG